MSLPMLQVALDNQTMDSAYETTRLIAEESTLSKWAPFCAWAKACVRFVT